VSKILSHKKIKSLEELHFKPVNACKRKTVEDQFANPIIKVDVSSGDVICNRLRLVWDSELVEYKGCPDN